jgi:hypothetical protein
MDYDKEREESEWWKVKKWAFGCLHRLFRKWGEAIFFEKILS